jgi:predicted nuclease of restriction endonuclease-like RecB superfamily
MKFRSKYEKTVYGNADGRKIEYEPDDAKLHYVTPSNYYPDFRIKKNGILIETKGYFKPRDRAKMLRVKKAHPKADIRFLFQRPNNRLTKSPNSLTYWQWAEKHGFPWAEGDRIPEAWFKERK